MANPHLPDPRFKVALYSEYRAVHLIDTAGRSPAHKVDWERVPDTFIFLVGDVHEQLRLLVDNYTTKELVEKLGIQPHALHLLRLHLGMPTGPTGQHGGPRPEKAKNWKNRKDQQ